MKVKKKKRTVDNVQEHLSPSSIATKILKTNPPLHQTESGSDGKNDKNTSYWGRMAQNTDIQMAGSFYPKDTHYYDVYHII